MQNPGSITFLVLFAVSTLLIYLSVRRGMLSLPIIAGVGAAANVLFFTLYSLSESVPFRDAIGIGLLVGLLFTGVTVAAATYFRANEQSRKAEAAAETSATETDVP